MIALVPGERDGHLAARSLCVGHELGRFGCYVCNRIRYLHSVIVAGRTMLRSLHDFLRTLHGLMPWGSCFLLGSQNGLFSLERGRTLRLHRLGLTENLDLKPVEPYDPLVLRTFLAGIPVGFAVAGDFHLVLPVETLFPFRVEPDSQIESSVWVLNQ